MAKSSGQKPGEPAKKSGTHIEKGPRGGSVPKPRTPDMDKGETLPPTQKPGRTWEPK